MMRARKTCVAASIALLGVGSAQAQVAGLTWNGMTLYGVYDIGYATQTHGTPRNDDYPRGLGYLIARNSNHRQSTIAPNGLGQTKVGIKGEWQIAEGWTAAANLETGFSPLSLQLADGLKSMTENNGVALSRQSSNGDSARAGQWVNGAAWVGLSSSRYGSLSVGRQNALLTEAVVRFDPLARSEAFSVLGASSVVAGGGGSQDTFLNQSVKYANTFDWLRVAVQAKPEGYDNGGRAFQLALGADVGQFSATLNYAQHQDAIAAAPLSGATPAGYASDRALAGTISDNTTLAAMAKYDGGNWQAYGGVAEIRFDNPSHGFQPGTKTLGGYVLATVNNAPYNHTRVLRAEWIGAKYFLTPVLSVTGAYYRYDQNSYRGDGCSDRRAASCSGALNATSAVLNYRYNKYLDVYGGAMRSSVSNGLASGYLNTASTTAMVGVRFVF